MCDERCFERHRPDVEAHVAENMRLVEEAIGALCDKALADNNLETLTLCVQLRGRFAFLRGFYDMPSDVPTERYPDAEPA